MAYVIFDTETTGLSPEIGDRMVEIAAVRVRNGVIVEETFHSLINPYRIISPGAARVNRITQEMLDQAPDSSIVIPAFLKFVGSDVLVAHNAPFDIAFLKSEMRLLGLNADTINTYLCTIELAKAKLPELKRFNLDAVMSHLGIDTDVRHRALGDVKATAQVFLKIHEEEQTLF